MSKSNEQQFPSKATNSFENELLFPTKLSTLHKEKIGFQALIVKIDEIMGSILCPQDLYFNCRTQKGDYVLVSFCFDLNLKRKDIKTYSSNDVKKGNILIVLNPCIYGSNRVVVRHPNECFFSNSSISEFKEHAERLLQIKDLINEKQKTVCYGCGDEKIERNCSTCVLVKYCSKECEKKEEKHNKFCKHGEVLLRLACMSRHKQADEFYCFLIDEQYQYFSSLPPYVYKVESVKAKKTAKK